MYIQGHGCAPIVQLVLSYARHACSIVCSLSFGLFYGFVVSHIRNRSYLTNSWVSMFVLFIFGGIEIRAEDCLMGTGYRDLELDGCSWIGVGFGSYWVLAADWFSLHFRLR